MSNNKQSNNESAEVRRVIISPKGHERSQTPQPSKLPPPPRPSKK